MDTPLSPLTTVDVKIFRHEFITVFRFAEAKTLHPADISVIEHIEDLHTRYEEESGTVFLARELMGRMRKMSWAAERERERMMRVPRSSLGRYSTRSSRQSLRQR